MTKLIRWWWRQPDHYEWFTSYLRARHMATMTRVILAVVSLALASVPLAMLFSTAPPVGMVKTGLALLAGFGGVAAALLWLVSFPTKRQSVAYAATASASVAAAVLAQSDPFIALLACTAFVTISGYIALFHTAVLMTINVVVVLVLPAIAMTQLAETRGVVYALSAGGLVLIVNIAIPFGIQIIVHSIGMDLVKADRDPLTGLMNRRAFYQRVARIAAAEPDDAHLVLAMVDLDRFKQLNDTHGHAVGDQALIEVAQALRGKLRDGAAIGRVGGEEFLIADALPHVDPGVFGESLCAAVDSLPYSLTASVGTSTVRCAAIRAARDKRALLMAMAGSADSAMYEAKRNGGNQSRHQGD